MIPGGYLLKLTQLPIGWVSPRQVIDVCSVAGCANKNVVDPQEAWLHNAFGVANDPETLFQLVKNEPCQSIGAMLFYYEVYEYEIESDGWTFDLAAWRPVSAAPSAAVSTEVSPLPPSVKGELLGYDVVTFGDFLEHSPLSCNAIADELPVNSHCLLDSLEIARDAINSGAFCGGCEEGVYKIFSVTLLTELPRDHSTPLAFKSV